MGIMKNNNRWKCLRVREWPASRIWIALAFMFFYCDSDAKADAPTTWTLTDHLGTVDKERTRYRQVGQENELLVLAAPGVKYNFLQFSPRLSIETNMVLRFEARRDSPDDQSISFAVSFATESGKKFWFSEKISGRRESFTYDFSTVKSDENESLLPGERFEQVSIYARNPKRQADLDMDFSIRNLRFVIEGGDTVSEKNEISYSSFPFFQWPPQGMETQLLQIARSPAFSDEESLRTVQVAEPQYVPEEGLAPGQWYWRYYMRGPLADRWSDTYRIYISEDATDFHFPKMDLKALGKKTHPRLADLARSHYRLNPLTDKQRAAFVASAKTPLPSDPETRGQSSLSSIEWLGQIGGKVVGRSGRRLEQLGKYLMATPDKTLQAPARKRLMEAAAWNPDGASSRRSDDLAAADFLFGMCWLFDALYEDLTPAERETVLDRIEARGEQFAEVVVPLAMDPTRNHTFRAVQSVGMAAMALVGHREGAGYWFESACNIFAYRILGAIGVEGETHEGISYWRYGGKMLADYADLLRAFCGINLYGHPWLKKTSEFPLYCAPPGGFAIGFSDMHFYGNTYLRGPYRLYGAEDYMARMTRETGFPYGAWYLGESIPGSAKQRPPFDLEPSRYWKRIGWSLFNTCLPNGYENVAVGFHAGTLFGSHQHADQNSFVINAYGDKLAIDGGYYDWYGSPHYKAYAIQTMAHNTVMVNGRGQAWRKDGADAKTTDFYSSLPYGYVVGDASDPEIYRGELRLFKRKLLFIKPNYIMIHDQLAATGKPAKFDWLIHSHTDDPMAFDGSNQTFSSVRPLARLDGRFLFPENVGLKVAPSYTVMPSERRSNAILAEEFIMPEWTLSGTAEPADGTEEYFVVMRVSKTADDTPLVVMDKFETETALGATLRDNGRVIRILSRKMGRKEGSLEHGQLVADADIACVECSADGVVQRAFLGEGTRLEYGGRPILQLGAPGNAHFDAQEEWGHRMLEPVSLIDGLPPFDAYCTQMSRSRLYMYSAEIDLSSNTVLSVDLAGISDPVYVHVNGRINAVPDSGEILVEAGSWFMTVSSRSDLSHLRMAIRKQPQAEE